MGQENQARQQQQISPKSFAPSAWQMCVTFEALLCLVVFVVVVVVVVISHTSERSACYLRIICACAVTFNALHCTALHCTCETMLLLTDCCSNDADDFFWGGGQKQDSNAVLQPCGHGGFCYDCAKLLVAKKNKCPLCRAGIDEVFEFTTQGGQVGRVGSFSIVII